MGLLLLLDPIFTLLVVRPLTGPLLVGLLDTLPLLRASDLLIAALLVGSVTLLVGLPEIGLGLLLLLPGLPLEPTAANPALAAAPKNAIIITYSVCLFFGWLLIFWDLCL